MTGRTCCKKHSGLCRTLRARAASLLLSFAMVLSMCGGAGILVDDAVLDHVGLDGGHGAEGPAGAVGVLVLDGGDGELLDGCEDKTGGVCADGCSV